MSHSQTLIDHLVEAETRGATLSFLDDRGLVESRRGWGDLLRAASSRAAALRREERIEPGDVVLLMGDSDPALVETLLAAIWLGAIPALLAPRRGQEHLRFIQSVLQKTCARRLLVGSSVLGRSSDYLAPLGGAVRPIAALAPDIAGAPRGPVQDTIWLQFSSGSTGTPRGILVTNRSVLHNLASIASNVGITPEDTLVSWLPLFHDMGLVAGLFGPPCWRGHGALMDPSTFAYRPATWLRAMSRLEATVSLAPNFAYELCVSRIDDGELAGVRLDSWRLSWNGAEMVLPETVRRFQRRFEPWGLRPNVISPCYGAAEATLMITSTRAGEAFRADVLSREGIARGRARPPEQGEAALEVASVGRPGPEMQVRVLDAEGEPVPERTVGEIEVRGPSVCPGYFADSDPRFQAHRWKTGDLGFFADGDLFITGRSKELLVLNGRNIYPHDLERIASEAAPGRIRRAAAFSVPDPTQGTERAIVAVELERPGTLDDQTREQIAAAVVSATGTSAVTIHPVPFVPITTSGKLQRAKLRTTYLAATGSKERAHVE